MRVLLRTACRYACDAFQQSAHCRTETGSAHFSFIFHPDRLRNCAALPLLFFQFKLQFLQRTLFYPGYIASAYSKELGDLALRLRGLAGKSVAQGYYLGLPLGESCLNTAAELGAALSGTYGVQHIVLRAENVHKGQAVAVTVCLNGVGEGNVTGRLPGAAKEHEYLVFYTAGCVCSQTHTLVRAVCGNSFYQTYRADGDEVILIGVLGVVFFKGLSLEEVF